MIAELFSKKTQSIFISLHPQPIQRMLDYDWLCKRKLPSVCAIVHPGGDGVHKAFWGTKEITIPVFGNIQEAAAKFPKADTAVNFASMRSAFSSSKEAILVPGIRTVAITAEGMPENETRELIRLAKENKKWIIGPATVGAIKPGAFRVGNTGGSVDSLLNAKLYRPGSVGVVTISGGMSLEIYTIAADYADGIYEGIAVGGDKYAGSTLLENLLRLEADKNVKMLIMLGEIGGRSEYEVADALLKGKIKKPLVAWVSGTVAKYFPTEVQFGHAGAKSGGQDESAQTKNAALREAGAFVPESFNDFGKLVEKVFKKHVKSKPDYKAPKDDGFQLPPMDFNEALAKQMVRRSSSITSTISDDRGDEPTYNKKTISTYVDKSIGELINNLWFKGRLNKPAEEFIEFCIKLSADHGPAVVTAHNAIATARAGKDLVDSLVTGLLTIGPRHGGAIDGAAKWAFTSVSKGTTARELIEETKRRGELIMGIGHRIKTAQNPDKRVTLLKDFAKKNLKSDIYLKFALTVEQETLKKKNNLILNVDGAIGTIFLDVLADNNYSDEEILEVIDSGALNGIFVLGRSIGIIGHVLDQKRLKEPLYRHPWDDILYL